ncbi:hypothetical protein BC940DRAFT_313625 [Gongronella butleri]|nr:hypothetical protein BC940DRAFT_313625 [Gongronella butleri]
MSKRSESISSSFSTVEARLQQQQDPLLHATSLSVQRLLDTLNRRSPINLRLLTVPLGKAAVKRLLAVEAFYGRSTLFRFLLRRGVPPVPLFLAASASLAWLLKRFYTHQKPLALNALGVAYPAYRCWHLVKRLDTHGHPMDQIKEAKSWLAYWMLYGSLQGKINWGKHRRPRRHEKKREKAWLIFHFALVLDNWRTDLLYLMPNYNLYKMVLLYWAQSPHSNGAMLLYQSILQKPEDDDDMYEQEHDDDMYQHQHQHQHQHEPSKEYRHTPLFDDNNEEELTITIGHAEDDDHRQHRSNATPTHGYRVIDGYTPPTLASRDLVTRDNTHSSGSSSSSSDHSHPFLHHDANDHPKHPVAASTNADYSMLVHPMATDPAW